VRKPGGLLLSLAFGGGLALAAGAVWRFGWSWELPAYLYLAAITVPLTVIDLREHRLPNALTLTAYPTVALLLAVPAAVAGSWGDYGRALLGGVTLLALYALLHLINPSGMGLGDVKLAGPLGALLGWLSWSHVFMGTLVGFVAAAVVGVGLMLAGRATRQSALPFGPFMLAGAWVAILAMTSTG
jgi:leader peptidase (prepilin peptidase) / N-methyltransferase